MYKIFSIKFLISSIVVLVGLAGLIRGALKHLLPGIEIPGISEIVSLFITAGIAWVWVYVWRFLPKMNEWFYPDLTGEWDVEMDSNWSRHEQVMDAALSTTATFDIRRCDVSDLAPLLKVKLKAEIKHTFWTIHMRLWSDVPGAPIKESEILIVEPFKAEGLKKCGLRYIFRQTSVTASVTDVPSFLGAAELYFDKKTDMLEGEFWSQRSWQRAMNTAGLIRMKRVTKKKSKRNRP